MSSVLIAPLNEEISPFYEETATMKQKNSSLELKISSLEQKISNLELKISRFEKEGKSEPYLINLGQQLVASNNLLVELMREKNILLEQRKTLETKLGVIFKFPIYFSNVSYLLFV